MAVSSSDAHKVHADWPTLSVVNDAQFLFDDPDIQLIVIPTPNDTHYSLAQRALAAGKHVVVDKPFTVTLSQAHQLKQQADAAGLLLSVFHNRRWDSDFLTLKTLIDQDVLGDVVYFESHHDRYRPEIRQRWREQSGVGSGIWYNLAPHLLDQALQLFGSPDTLHADLGLLRNEAQSVDYFHATLSYPRQRVILHATLLAAAETARYIVHGSRGSYIKFGLDPQEERLKAGEPLPQSDWGHDLRDGIVTLSQNGVQVEQSLRTIPGNYPAYYAAIHDAILGKGENPVSAADAIKVMELIELGIASNEQKKTLMVKPN